MATVVQQPAFKANISYHAWNADNTLIALSPNNSDVYIYKTGGSLKSSDWKGKNGEPDYSLEEHGGDISGIEWCHATNTIVTCGHDRNAYVWKYNKDEDAWKPTLVILRIDRAATAVKWSPKGDKFAVTSGAKCVPICHFEQSNDWWISKMIKKHKSTVNCVDWSPNGKYIVTGSCDFKARICSAFIDGVDTAGDDEYSGMWKKQHEFGEVLAEFDMAKAWVNGVAWNPSGKSICYTGHGSTIHFAHFGGGEQTINVLTLPLNQALFLTENTLAAVCFDNNIQLFVNNGSADSPNWSMVAKVDPETDGKAAAGGAKKGFGSAFNKFQQADSKGAEFGAAVEEKLCYTFHKNTVYSIQKIKDKWISTGAMDGRILAWDLSGIKEIK